MRPILLLFGLAVTVAASAAAQQLRDPTRPPSVERVVVKKSAQPKLQPVPTLVLQTVLVSPDRRNAIINGRLLWEGDSIVGFELLHIRETEVVMKGPRGLQTLQLYPAAKKVETAIEPSVGDKKGVE